MRGVSFETRDEDGGRVVRIGVGSLEFRLDVEALRLEVNAPGLALPSIRPGAIPALDLRAGRRALGIGDVKGLAGPALRLEVQQIGCERGVRWTLEVTPDPPAVVFELALENRSAAAWEVDSLAAVAFAPGAALPNVLPEPCFPDLTLARSGGRHVALGFTTAHAGGGRPDDRGAWQPAQPIEAAGERVSDRAWLAIGSHDATPLRLEWARRAALEMDARCPAPPRVRDAATPDEPELLVGRGPSGLAATGVVEGFRVPVGAVLDHWLGNQRLWLTAPEPVGAELGSLGPEALRTRLSTLGLAAGVVTLDGERSLPARIRRTLGRVLPPLARPAWRLPTDDPDEWLLAVPLRAGRTALLVVNRSGAACEVALDPSALGADAPQHVYDFWDDRYEGIVDGRFDAGRIAPGACRVLCLSPINDAPQVVGSSLHIGMGTLEVGAVRETELVLRHPGAHDGVVWIAPGGTDPPRRVPVRFRDKATVPL